MVVTLIVGGWYLVKKTMVPVEEEVMVGDNLEVGDALLEKFEKMGEVSETAEKAELRPVTGRAGSGIATREVINGKLVHTVMADLSVLGEGEFYEGWLVGKTVVSTGKLAEKKGGWLLEYVGEASLADYDSVVITLERKDDGKPEAHVLEGLFK